LRWKWDRFKEKFGSVFGGNKEAARPKLCPACGTLVGANATRCHQCGASMTFSLAAASRSLEKLMPMTSPVTYGILSLSCLLYAASLLWTIRLTGFQAPSGGGFSALFNLGGISGQVLQNLGASLPLPYDLAQPWRYVMAVFLHGSLMHIGFNMWVLMDVGPLVEETYGSARYLFLYVITGIAGYILSSIGGHFSIGGSGALMGLIGALLALTMGRRNASLQMLRGQLIRFLIYMAIFGIMVSSVDNLAHIGGLAAGFVLGKFMVARPPVAPDERKHAYALGWATAIVVIASFSMVAFQVLHVAK
jgi:rhomboid protease GluP